MRHLHLYCENKYIQETRDLVNDILEEKMRSFIDDAAQLQYKTEKQTNLALKINRLMHELPTMIAD